MNISLNRNTKFLYLTVVVFSTLVLSAHAQNQPLVDSLLQELQIAKEDTNKVKILINLCWEYRNSHPDTALYYNGQGFTLAEKLKYNRGIANSYNNIGEIHKHQGNYEKALEYYLKSLKIYEEINYKKGIAVSYNNIGLLHNNQGHFEKALEYYLKSLKIYEEINDKKGIAISYNNIGNIYIKLGNYEKALKYYLKSLKIYEEMGDKNGMASPYTNIGNIHLRQGNYEQALEYYLKSLKIYKEAGNKNDMGGTYGNIGLLYNNQGNYEKALVYYLKSLKIDKEIGDKNGMTYPLNGLAEIAMKMENYKEALEYARQAAAIAKEIGALSELGDAYSTLTKVNAMLNNGKKAVEYFELYNEVKDSLQTEEITKQIAEMQTKYETEKKEQEIALLNKDKALQEAEIAKKTEETQKQKVVIGSVIVGLVLMICFAFFIVNRLRITREQKQIIEAQKQIVDEKNKDIMDSITYAKRIQDAILPASNIVQQYLPNSFVLYKPKDIVSGDFYWMEAIDGKVLFAVVDCTGHGVPGAFVSIVGHNGLNRAVNEFGLREPAKILDKLNELVEETFSGSTDEVRDGMDIAICSLDIKNNILEYAGANNPLYHIKEGELTEVKANKQPIGKYDKRAPFANHTIQLEQGDSIYIFTDGFADQFGGPKGKKFKYKEFKETLLANHNNSMQEQREILNKTIEEWRGGMEQIDDICVIGVKV